MNNQRFKQTKHKRRMYKLRLTIFKFCKEASLIILKIVSPFSKIEYSQVSSKTCNSTNFI
ncbi:hypothetical protein Hanom_Chr00s000001g01595021 [Helianthus anomalus]